MLSDLTHGRAPALALAPLRALAHARCMAALALVVFEHSHLVHSGTMCANLMLTASTRNSTPARLYRIPNCPQLSPFLCDELDVDDVTFEAMEINEIGEREGFYQTRCSFSTKVIYYPG